jgi:hypothetical protein
LRFCGAAFHGSVLTRDRSGVTLHLEAQPAFDDVFLENGHPAHRDAPLLARFRAGVDVPTRARGLIPGVNLRRKAAPCCRADRRARAHS